MDNITYITLAQWANRHKISRQRASILYKQDRITGAISPAPGVVLVPEDAALNVRPYKRQPKSI